MRPQACLHVHQQVTSGPSLFQNLELPPRVHLQKASKMKQIWELWSMTVALAMPTWNDVAVTFWHWVYHQSEESYHDWRQCSMTERFACEKRYLYGRKAPVPSACGAVEALLRHELLSHFPDWLSRKAGALGCTSSHTICAGRRSFRTRMQPDLISWMSSMHFLSRCPPACINLHRGLRIGSPSLSWPMRSQHTLNQGKPWLSS